MMLHQPLWSDVEQQHLWQSLRSACVFWAHWALLQVPFFQELSFKTCPLTSVLTPVWHRRLSWKSCQSWALEVLLFFLRHREEPVSASLRCKVLYLFIQTEAQHGGWPAGHPLFRHFMFCAAVKRDNNPSLSRNVLRSVGSNVWESYMLMVGCGVFFLSCH